MSPKTCIGGVVLTGALAVLVFQKASISRVRAANESLRQGQQETAPTPAESERAAELRREAGEVEALRAANQDLLKLRSEVRQLRAQAIEMEKLRKQNQRLASAIKSTADSKVPFSQMEGFVGTETWSNGGFASPEAALQTFLWAVREGRLEQIAECLSPESRPGFEREFAGKSEEERTAALQRGLGQLARTSGYRLVDKEELADDKVKLGIQAVAGGVVAKVVLMRFGNEWKFHDAGAK
jgi:hypothetical protein